MAKQTRVYPLKVSLKLLTSSGNTATAADDAVTILNRAQGVFNFEVSSGPLVILDDGEGCHTWARIEAVLGDMDVRRDADFVFGLLDEPIENNWFSRAAWGRATGLISTHSWEFISTLPMASFVAYELVENLVELLWIADEAEGQQFIAEVVHHGEGRGCLNDMCEFKPRIGIKIRTGDICPDCLNLLEARLEKKELKAVQRMLDAVRMYALGREPQVRRSASMTMSEQVPQWEEPMLMKATPGVPPLKELPTPNAPQIECCQLDGTPELQLSRGVGSSPAEVDQHYPFPVAHCFRAMRVEFTGTRKFKTLLQLYSVITKYLTIVLLASRTRSPTTDDSDLRELLGKLKFAGLGQWGKACFWLLRERLADRSPGFLDHLMENIAEVELRACEEISKDFVKLRNETEGHGFVQSEDTYERHFLRQIKPAQRLLALMQPLANYTLCRLVQVKSNRGGKCVYDARILQGSNPLFEVQRLESATVPESDCLLRHPYRDEQVNLWPWLMLEDCPQCLRQMVFLYDHLEQANVVFREYPNNHCKRNGELAAEITNRIG